MIKGPDLVLQSREGEREAVGLDPEGLGRAGLAQRIQRLPRGEGQLQQLAGAVHHLAGGNIAGAAQLGGPNVGPLRLHQQKLRGAAGEMPGQVGPVHQLQTPGGPERRRHMALLVGDGIARHVQRSRRGPRRHHPGQEAGHIRALHGPRPGGDGHRLHCRIPHVGQEALQQRRQALDMGEDRVALPEAQLARGHI